MDRPRDYTRRELQEWLKTFPRERPEIVRCPNCNDDVTSYQRGKLVWCPRCNRNHI